MKKTCPRCGGRLARRRNRCYRCTGRPRSGEQRTCEACDKPFYVAAWQLRQDASAGRFCSRRCKHAHARGRERVTGTRSIRADGYVAVKVGIRAYELEHRLVMAQIIGRPLRTDEHVHHVNGRRADNRPENLQKVSAEDHGRMHPDQPQYRRSRVSLVCHRCGRGYDKPRHRRTESKYCANACRLAALHEGNRKPQ